MLAKNEINSFAINSLFVTILFPSLKKTMEMISFFLFYLEFH